MSLASHALFAPMKSDAERKKNAGSDENATAMATSRMCVVAFETGINSLNAGVNSS